MENAGLRFLYINIGFKPFHYTKTEGLKTGASDSMNVDPKNLLDHEFHSLSNL